MKKTLITVISLVYVLCMLLMSVPGCVIGNTCRAKVEWSETHVINLARNSIVSAKTCFGSIKLTDVVGDIQAHTSFASIDLEHIRGAIDVETSYGAVKAVDVTPTVLDAETSFSGIDIACSADTAPELTVKLKTSYGGIDFKSPPNYTGQVELKTSHGSIKTDWPVTVKGSLDKDHISGWVGDGNGKIRLKTSFGSIQLK